MITEEIDYLAELQFHRDRFIDSLRRTANGNLSTKIDSQRRATVYRCKDGLYRWMVSGAGGIEQSTAQGCRANA
jgi:hypothetical protein